MGISPSQKKAKLSRKWVAKLTNSTIMEKVFKNIERDIDSDEIDHKKLATDQLFKILPYIMPKEGNGNGPLIAINNNTQINGEAGDKVLKTIAQFMLDRTVKTEALEKRQEIKLEPKEVKVEKLPANTPLNK